MVNGEYNVSDEYFKHFLRHNVLTASEVAEILEVTRQTVNLYVKEGKIEFIKNTPNGMLFFKPDIEKYKAGSTGVYTYNLNQNHVISEYSGVTRKSLIFFEENINKFDEIIALFIYFEDFDSILDGFYSLSEHFSFGELKALENPTFVLRDKNGRELWLSGCNCGYGGEGPHGSITILEKLGFNKDIIERVYEYRVIKLFKDKKGWDCITHSSQKVDVLVDDGFRYGVPNATIYYYKNRLVLLQKESLKWDVNPVLLLEKYRAFIPNPVEISIFESNRQAQEYGYFVPDFGRFSTNVFKMVITDQSSRQLWLNPFFYNDISLDKQSHVLDILKYCGFNVKEKNVFDKFKSWFNKDIRKIPPQPLYLVK